MRFAWVLMLAAFAVSLIGRVFSDFDQPGDPHDLIRGIGVWLTAALIATLDAVRLNRRLNSR